ncbi:hypothetical protein [uncultured Psychroserpens sp.]|uniref:hypothetical protein n=1 Tax=uncultured Psychroserpens sp. TaxID=255436 RepID=UPI00262C4E33|nr:hypothetical protein [uncultured Psychroserpens sp.]
MMKPIDFKVENHTISYKLNWLGVETVLLDGKIISKKVSLGKRVHTFNLIIDGVSHTFHLESKQSFSTSSVRVQLFQNGKLLDTDHVEFFQDSKNNNTTHDHGGGSSFMIGILLIFFSMSFDWPRFFLFIGLIFLFDAVSKSHAKQQKDNQKQLENND